MRFSEGVEQKKWKEVRGLLQQKKELKAALEAGTGMKEKEKSQKKQELNQLEKRLEKSEELTRRVL